MSIASLSAPDTDQHSQSRHCACRLLSFAQVMLFRSLHDQGGGCHPTRGCRHSATGWAVPVRADPRSGPALHLPLPSRRGEGVHPWADGVIPDLVGAERLRPWADGFALLPSSGRTANGVDPNDETHGLLWLIFFVALITHCSVVVPFVNDSTDLPVILHGLLLLVAFVVQWQAISFGLSVPS
ncbi:hypothetical protein ABZ897_07990 [Nonomuraea sp. NPDC046802]|uniref:hypothetical protein n=1 Tax=Nonomuraea sp. NPDC046802 TaxID=3154919 RepID=UPI003404B880